MSTRAPEETLARTRRHRFESVYPAIVRKRRVVPRLGLAGRALGDGEAAARQLDAALLSVGFKLSRRALTYFSELESTVVVDAGRELLDAVRRLVGDHVRHNSYFIDFPRNVPDTLEFWAECIGDALRDPELAPTINEQLDVGLVNLLGLPRYGRYQHPYEEMLARHDELIPALKDRVTILELGEALEEESQKLYLSLAGSPVPLGPDDLALLRTLAEVHAVDGVQPGEIPVRENRAEINRARIQVPMPILVDTPLDVLRLAAALSDGDVSLAEPTRFRSFRRVERRVMMAALDAAVTRDYKLGDVPRFAEQFKRLGERLHPHEYPRYEGAQDVFRVARGEKVARSIAGRADCLIAAGQLAAAIGELSHAPGLLVRNADYLLRLAAAEQTRDSLAYSEVLVDALRGAFPKTSTRVLLSLREHLLNRSSPAPARIFVNRRGRAWVTPDERPPLDEKLTRRVCDALDAEIRVGLPRDRVVVLDEAAAGVALPLSEKTKPGGLGVLPRGSVARIEQPSVRFFVYWKQRERRTDYDLSTLFLDENFEYAGHVSWTNLYVNGITYSGDLVEAPDGATEFIDVELDALSKVAYLVPQVHVYAGEGFDEVEEVFFGYMERDPAQKGRPFEPRTVRMKSDLFGSGRASLPMVFARTPSGWEARWLHLTLRGHAMFNRVESNRVSAGLLAKTVVDRRYLTLNYLSDVMGGARAQRDEFGAFEGRGAIFLCADRPETIPSDAEVYDLTNLSDLLR